MWRRQDDRQCTLLEEDEVCWRFLGRADRQRQSGKQQAAISLRSESAAARERARDGRAAEQRDEVAPFQPIE
jgi:hypothetical protein